MGVSIQRARGHGPLTFFKSFRKSLIIVFSQILLKDNLNLQHNVIILVVVSDLMCLLSPWEAKLNISKTIL